MLKPCPRCALGLATVALICTCEEAFRRPEIAPTFYTAADQPHNHDDGPRAPFSDSGITIRESTASRLSPESSLGLRPIPASIASSVAMYWITSPSSA